MELKDEEMEKEYCGKVKRLSADDYDKIRKRYLSVSQVTEKCDLVQMEKAQPGLNVGHPATVKCLLESHVSGGFNLPLLAAFCRAHLPLKNTVMVLETESGEQYETMYLARYCRLSGGWRRFAIDMKLEAGDAVVFNLVEATKFKVYFIRKDLSTKVTLPVHRLNPSIVKPSVSSKTNGNQLSLIGKCDFIPVEKAQPEVTVGHPATVKWLLESHVSGGFNLPLFTPFCRAHLPLENTIMVLESESGVQYESKYLARSCKLSGGWRRFAMDMKLEAGDGVVFNLVEATKFKVNFIKKEFVTKVILPVHLLNPISHVEPSVSSKTNTNQLIVYWRGEVHQVAQNYNLKSPRLKSKNAGEFTLYPREILFNNITDFEEFNTIIHKLLQNHKLPYSTLHDYYELCCSQNAFLHADLFRGINPGLNSQIFIGSIKRVIFETVGLANTLRTCKLSTFLKNYALWEKTLNVYKALGMNVNFLLARLHHLKNLAFCSEGTTDHRSRYREASHERGRAEGEVMKLKLILANLRLISDDLKSKRLEEKYREGCSWLVCAKAEIVNLEVLIMEIEKFFSQYDAHIETLKLKAKTCELKFQEEVSAPW